MKINEIAKAYGVTKSAVEKWPQQKRQRAIKLLSAGVDPHVMDMVGQIQSLAYAASCVRKDAVMFTCTQHYATLTIGAESETIALFEGEGLFNAKRKLEAIIYGGEK